MSGSPSQSSRAGTPTRSSRRLRKEQPEFDIENANQAILRTPTRGHRSPKKPPSEKKTKAPKTEIQIDLDNDSQSTPPKNVKSPTKPASMKVARQRSAQRGRLSVSLHGEEPQSTTPEKTKSPRKAESEKKTPENESVKKKRRSNISEDVVTEVSTTPVRTRRTSSATKSDVDTERDHHDVDQVETPTGKGSKKSQSPKTTSTFEGSSSQRKRKSVIDASPMLKAPRKSTTPIKKVEKKTPQKPAMTRTGRRSAVDDDFFSVVEMNEKLDQLEKTEETENILGLLDNDGSDSDGDIMYTDFFEEGEEKPSSVMKKKKVEPEEYELESGESSELEDMGLDPETEKRGFDFNDSDSDEEVNKSGPFKKLFAQQEVEFEEPMELDNTMRSLRDKSHNSQPHLEEGEDNDKDEEEDNQDFAEDEDEVEEEEDGNITTASKKVHFAGDNDDLDEEEEVEDEEVEERELEPVESDEEEEDLSRFKKEQKNLKKVVKELEEENLAPRPWELSGEVKASERDQDGLLEKYVEVDYKAKTAPVIDEDVNMRIESIVKQRIKDKAFDDPIRTKKVAQSLQTFRAKTLDDVERKSLMEMYEQEYKNKVDSKNEKDEEEEGDLDEASKAIKGQMSTIFSKLDQLSHAKFRPEVVDDEPKLIVNKPAIQVEEVGQKASTAPDEELLAPEEIHKRAKGVIKSKEERDKTDKLRERRKKKRKQTALVKKGVKKEGEYKAAKELEEKEKAKKKPVKSVKQAEFYDKIQELNQKEAIEKTTKAKKMKKARVAKIDGKNATAFKL